MSYIELVLALGIIVVVMSVAAPVTAHAIDAGRARSAAGFIAARFRLAREQAADRNQAIGIVFDLVDGRWVFEVCRDGNGDGIRRVDIAAGRDVCPEGPYDLQRLFPGTQVAVDGSLPGPDGDAASSDPVRFGRSNIASFSPAGTCTAGTLFLRSPKGVQYAVRVGNITGRTRTLRYDAPSRKWNTE